MKEVVVISARRTAGRPRAQGNPAPHAPGRPGRRRGARSWSPITRAWTRRASGDVIMGCAMPEAEQGMNVGRNIALMAGPAGHGARHDRQPLLLARGSRRSTTRRLKIARGQAEVVIAGGVETMTMVPMGGLRYLPSPAMAQRTPRVPDQHGPHRREPGRAATASRREAQDEFAFHSHRKAVAAHRRRAASRTRSSRSWPRLPGRDAKGRPVAASDVEFKVDEGPRADTTVEALAKLKPAFKVDGTVTAGNTQPDERRRRGGRCWPRPSSRRAIGAEPAGPLRRLRGGRRARPRSWASARWARCRKALAQAGLRAGRRWTSSN